MRTLRKLGFGVINADDDAAPGDKLEDLDITDSEHPGWLAIAEVKGYTKGAQTAAFQQLARFSARYLQRTGTSPSAEWYIANQFRKQDPSTRQPILHGTSEDIRTFASAAGLIIDTATLFRILDYVRTGSCTPAEARAHIRSATGVLTRPLGNCRFALETSVYRQSNRWAFSFRGRCPELIQPATSDIEW
jgi:hypothetical protein